MLYITNFDMMKKPLALTFLFTVFVFATAWSQSVMDAVNKSDTALLLKLIKKASNLNEVDSNGNTPLMVACRWGDAPVVRMLLNNGANPNVRTAKGRTPLMIACANQGGETVCRLLISKGADVNAAANNGATALMLAALNAKVDVIEVLLDKGANAKAEDKKGYTALDYATNAEISPVLTESVKDTRVDKNLAIAQLKQALTK